MLFNNRIVVSKILYQELSFLFSYQNINFNDISFILTNKKLKYSYLTSDEFQKILNFPIKEKHSFEIDPDSFNMFQKNNGICLVVLKKDDINLNLEEFINNLKKIPFIQITRIQYVNKKLAAILSGLGQYGKNQLIYNEDYGFHFGIELYLIFNPVINLPDRNPVKYTYMDKCNNCNECIKNCPVQAIHLDEYLPWVDEDKCRNFYLYGDHEKISSTKYGINAFLNHKFSVEQLKSVQDKDSFENLFQFENKENQITKDGKTYFLDIKYCRECMNQIPCRKMEYVYDKNSYTLLKEI